MRVDGQVDRHLDRLGRALAGELADRFGDELAVEIEADGRDVPGLRATEQVAGATDLQVAHRDLEARAELGELTDRLQPLVGLFAQRVVARVQRYA